MRYFAAAFVRLVTDARLAPAVVLWFAMLHAVLWTVALTSLKAAQDVHMDVAEAFAWGQKFQLGYGKHPPLSGWLAGLWFMALPVRDWSTYALAMATVAASLVICWHIAVKVVDRRRAFLTVLMLALYPVFNFKGFKYNADLLQLVTLPLVVLAFLHAFERRSVRAGFLLGLAGLAAMMTKYWALTVIGAVGIAALVHPDRLRFLASPAPWVALATLIVGMIPHARWVVQVDFAPLTYAGDVYERSSRLLILELSSRYVGHYVALLAPVLILTLIVLLPPLGRMLRARAAGASTPWLRSDGSGVNVSQARHVWLIQAILGLVPPLAAVALTIYIKTDWGIPLFFLVPLCLVAIPRLGVPRIALPRLAVLWLVFTLAMLIASPWIAKLDLRATPAVGSTSNPTSQFAQQLTQLWHEKFQSRWAAVAGTTEVGEPMTFYSPDHPAPFTPGEIWSSGLITFDQAKRLGFIGICDTSDTARLAGCEAWMKTNAPNAEQININARRFFRGKPGPSVTWQVYLEPPAP